MKKLILASSSPRRHELLKLLGLNFKTFVCQVDETPPPGLLPFELVELLAMKKANAAAGVLNEGIVIGADTIVFLDGRVLGKPCDEEEAYKMLKLLQGNAHEVFTGVALVDAESKKALAGHEKTKVFFREIDDEEIRRYVETKEPMDKAGAYAVQGLGAIFIKGIAGCYSNVVGLPLAKLSAMLKQFDYYVL